VGETPPRLEVIMKLLISIFLLMFTLNVFSADVVTERKKVTPDFTKKKQKNPEKKPTSKAVPASKQKPKTEPAK